MSESYLGDVEAEDFGVVHFVEVFFFDLRRGAGAVVVFLGKGHVDDLPLGRHWRLVGEPDGADLTVVDVQETEVEGRRIDGVVAGFEAAGVEEKEGTEEPAFEADVLSVSVAEDHAETAVDEVDAGVRPPLEVLRVVAVEVEQQPHVGGFDDVECIHLFELLEHFGVQVRLRQVRLVASHQLLHARLVQVLRPARVAQEAEGSLDEALEVQVARQLVDEQDVLGLLESAADRPLLELEEHVSVQVGLGQQSSPSCADSAAVAGSAIAAARTAGRGPSSGRLRATRTAACR